MLANDTNLYAVDKSVRWEGGHTYFGNFPFMHKGMIGIKFSL